MSDVVQRAKQALEGVSEGPWEAQEWDSHANGDRGCGILAGIGMQQRGIAYVGLYWWNPQAQAEADAEFIAAARSLVPELIAEVERLNGLLASSADEAKSLRKRLLKHYSKWRIRKQGGYWQVWRPGEVRSIVEFPSFAALLLWQPDCESFLKGHCFCRTECAR